MLHADNTALLAGHAGACGLDLRDFLQQGS
jgi:hypothetical protein